MVPDSDAGALLVVRPVVVGVGSKFDAFVKRPESNLLHLDAFENRTDSGLFFFDAFENHTGSRLLLLDGKQAILQTVLADDLEAGEGDAGGDDGDELRG